jgi:hypothetical protein
VNTILIAAWILALATPATAMIALGEASAQDTLTIGVDADPAGNTATSLESIDSCVSVSKGDTFDVDLFVTGVQDLRAWESYFSFDASIVNVVDLDVEMLQAANAGSDVFNASQTLPLSGGLFRVAAIDFGLGAEPDAGSGVLARLTLEAVGAGLSSALLTKTDENGDGTIDLGPILFNPRSEPIGDADGDPYFDGPISDAQIAVDVPCPDGFAATPATSPAAAASPQPSPADGGTPVLTAVSTVTSTATAVPPSPGATRPATPSASPTAAGGPIANDDDGSDWTSGPFIIAYVVGGGLAVLLLGGAILSVVRRRSL